MAREFAKSFYKSKEWKQARSLALMRDSYLCVKCGRPATVVHHIEHLSESNIDKTEVSISLDNLASLCDDCHFDAHRGEHAKGRASGTDIPEYEYTFDENGMLIPVHSPGIE